MNPIKETKVKVACFEAAFSQIQRQLEDGDYFVDEDINEVYSLALKLFTDGKHRYWASEKRMIYTKRWFKKLVDFIKVKIWISKEIL